MVFVMLIWLEGCGLWVLPFAVWVVLLWWVFSWGLGGLSLCVIVVALCGSCLIVGFALV